jgi:Spy/CpxP family protein refolding chaperone
VRKARTLVIALTLAAGLALFGVAKADAPVGNSGHSNNGSTQCKAGGNDHCPPFGGDK